MQPLRPCALPLLGHMSPLGAPGVPGAAWRLVMALQLGSEPTPAPPGVAPGLCLVSRAVQAHIAFSLL